MLVSANIFVHKAVNIDWLFWFPRAIQLNAVDCSYINESYLRGCAVIFLTTYKNRS